MGQFEGLMDSTSSGSGWISNQERTLGEVPCQNCGKMVTVILPFVGCVFCGDCMLNDSGQYDGTEDFYEPKRLKKEHVFFQNIRNAIRSIKG